MTPQIFSEVPLAVYALCRRYGNRMAIDDLSLEVKPGEVVGLLGPNGAGKTTLLETIEGIQSPTRGEVRVFGHAPRRLPAQVRGNVSFVFQRNALPEHVTVAQFMGLYEKIHGPSPQMTRTAERLGLSHLLTRIIGELSVGQRQRVSVFAALAGSPALVLMDEPTSALDLRSRRAVWDAIIEGKHERSMAGLIATHDMEEAKALCDRVLFLEAGQLRGSHSVTSPVRGEVCTTVVEFDAPAEVIHSSTLLRGLDLQPGNGNQRWQAHCLRQAVPELVRDLLLAEQEFGFDARIAVDPQQIQTAYFHHVSQAD